MSDVLRVKADDKEIILVGTAHISDESAKLAERTIIEEKPDAVAVELDKKRYDMIVRKKKWSETEIVDVVRRGNTYLLLSQILLSNFQKRLGEEVGVEPGSEMIRAIKAARKNGIDVELVDRDVQITFKRAIAKTSFVEKTKVATSIIYGMFGGSEKMSKELVEEIKKKDIMTELMNELSKEMPSVKETLIDERDEYIADNILAIKGRKVVAVVGKGHIEGISKNLAKKKANKNKRKADLESVPAGKGYFKYIKYSVPALFIAIVAWGFFSHGAGVTYEMLARWALTHGVLAALGVVLALGHPASVLTAFFAAPFTSLNPALAAGWFAGITELYFRKPKVKDIEAIENINGIGSLWGNNITRALLVVAFANAGSSLGTIIALPYLAALI